MNILFLCTGNSCRSQMAEGFANHYHSNLARFYSAGIVASRVDPLAIEVMRAIEIDISEQASKSIEAVANIHFDHVFTLCDHAQATCPIFPQATKTTHVAFNDPPSMAKQYHDKTEIIACYERVRDDIKQFILNFESYI